MDNRENQHDIFPKGDIASPDYFTGTAYIKILVPKDETGTYTVGNVLFKAGSRNNWHTHEKGQILLIIDGKGFYQEKGKPARAIKKGDVVIAPENIAHWHGASAKNKMVDIAITNYKGDEQATWLQPVTDEEYNSVQ